ncbi:hypothetical protein A3I18_00515 [Candidatus Campbellbacteria bacterium RIFCSPLOWO2_02_FULL_35_11]|uniref:Uncharacterized protein n=2 Tax=Candidatus Campbelliibacteriota TaxID=1752727 RepID=A0A1F5EKV1_9BACT|nr:MAG: hypothetical protein A3E89_00585 [Candidatus Campbellbacteria bacterium RIFCSPHIGHO2_12_FULL_35_10]OGD70481.1 MAG: hypothetical protein A3I18_00515 [Candidatus Campbellbacteria bacterium RIFCSPLOWO2_02_FULL_35_11]
MKKIIFSLGTIALVGAVVIGGTYAFFNDTETSSGNIFTAGNLDLKVDHVKQTYNDIDCKTCNVVVVSDSSNRVVEKNGSSVTPYDAVLAWVHPVWTAQNDPNLISSGAEWIWEANPTKQEDTTQDTSYTFRKTFEWWGPIVDSDLWFAIGSDNSVEVWLNGVLIGTNNGEFGYKQESMLHIPGNVVTSNVVQGTNTLEFKVKNWALVNGTPYSNPAGLIYKFSIDGQCGDDYFRNHCSLWGEKDLGAGDTFFNFDDIKPGDRGRNVISMHVYDNDAWLCLLVGGLDNQENTIYESESSVGDTTDPAGELGSYITGFAWRDLDQDGYYDPSDSETAFGDVDSFFDAFTAIPLYDSTTGNGVLTATSTDYVGFAWCAGEMTVDEEDGGIICDGSGMKDDAQSDSLSANLTAYVEQVRNNTNFSCSNLPDPSLPLED